jgi:putative peptidoglycan lipid II flippase
MKIRPMKPVLSSRVRRLLILMGPGVLAAGVQQVNNLIGQQIASQEEGVVGALSFADRLYQMPNGMIGAAFGVVLLPEISRLLRSGKELEAKETMGDGVVMSMLLTLPAAAALAIIPVPFVRALYEGGEFGADSVSMVASATIGYAFGVPAFVLMKVLQAGFFARENTKAPLKIAVVTVIVNIVLSLILFPYLKALGIALATTASAWVNVALLGFGLRGRMGVDRARVVKLVKILVASLVMGLGVWLLSQTLDPWMDGGFVLKWGAVLVLVAAGGVTYGVLALVLKATSFAELKAGFKR